MKIFIATDHRGVDIQKEIINHLTEKNIEVIESTLPHNDTDDYVDFAIDVSKSVVSNPGSMGILICGTGIGMSIAANKVKGIRAANCHSVMDAYHTRNDNDSNILCLGYNQNLYELYDIIDMFISTNFSNEERHIRRVNKITKYESGEVNEL